MSHTIDYRLGEIPDTAPLWSLHQSAEAPQKDSAEQFRDSVANSTWVATAWDEGRLVGLMCVLSDGVWAAYVLDFLVHPDFHHQGVVKELFDRYEQTFGHYRHQLVITGEGWVRDKFLKRGFHDESDALSRRHALA